MFRGRSDRRAGLAAVRLSPVDSHLDGVGVADPEELALESRVCRLASRLPPSAPRSLACWSCHGVQTPSVRTVSAPTTPSAWGRAASSGRSCGSWPCSPRAVRRSARRLGPNWAPRAERCAQQAGLGVIGIAMCRTTGATGCAAGAAIVATGAIIAAAGTATRTDRIASSRRTIQNPHVGNDRSVD